MANNIDYNIENIHISRYELAKISVAKTSDVSFRSLPNARNDKLAT